MKKLKVDITKYHADEFISTKETLFELLRNDTQCLLRVNEDKMYLATNNIKESIQKYYSQELQEVRYIKIEYRVVIQRGSMIDSRFIMTTEKELYRLLNFDDIKSVYVNIKETDYCFRKHPKNTEKHDVFEKVVLQRIENRPINYQSTYIDVHSYCRTAWKGGK